MKIVYAIMNVLGLIASTLTVTMGTGYLLLGVLGNSQNQFALFSDNKPSNTKASSVLRQEDYITSFEEIVKIRKIAIVTSYNYDHWCSTPQVDGVIKRLRRDLRHCEYSDRYEIRNFYMNTKTLNTTLHRINSVSKTILSSIEKFRPDYIVTIDDNAFEYVGIPLSKEYPVFFSGINKCIKVYERQFPFIKERRIYGIRESIDLTLFFKLLSDSYFHPDKFYILTEGQNSVERSNTCKYIYTEVEESLKALKVPPADIQVIETYNANHLKNIILELNNKPSGVIIISAQRLPDSTTGKFIDIEEINKIILRANRKHLELNFNKETVKNGLAISCGPDFTKMGWDTAEKLLNFTKDLKEVPRVSKASTEIAVNIQRLDELHLSILYKASSPTIKYTFSNY